jgi:hypothetical protein
LIGFSIGTGTKDYDGWSSDHQTTVKAEFVNEEERGGVKTYVFESSLPANCSQESGEYSHVCLVASSAISHLHIWCL